MGSDSKDTTAPKPEVAVSRRTASRLAGLADTDIRSALKALAYGARAVRGRPGERIAEVAAREGIALGHVTPSSPPPQAA